MAVFTAIATAIVGAIGVTGIAATIATSIIAGGLAFGTAKVLGVFKPPQMTSQKDPGVKIQLPPQTDNKIPVFYGRNVTGGIIVDAGIKNQNNTMQYVLCISEKTDSGTYTVNKIYRDDTQLVFNASGSVTSATDPNGTASNNVNGKMRCRVYAGNAQSSVNQIFPTTNKVAAQTLLPTITANTNYEGLVYAIFDIDYDPENGLTGLGAINFDIENSLSEPSNVLLDYLQNDRYGAGLSSSDLDLTSFNDLYDYSTALVPYTTNAGVGSTQQRWRVDGMLSTYVPVKQNIDALCQTCSTFFTYNPKEGKFAVVPNRAATTAEKSAAYTLTDDNMIGAINITSTDLYGLYNKMEVEYPSLVKKDQTDTVFITTPAGDKNPNEPENKLSTRYPLVNDNTRVENLANIDLRQSRTSLVVEVNADYEAITVDAGDIVKLTNSEYGFSEKLFRCMRTTEQETTDGMLNASLVLLEYSDDVYTHSNVQSRNEPGLSGIPGWWTGIWGNIDYSNIANIVGNVTIVDDPTGGNANIVDPLTGNVTGNVGLGNTNVVYPPNLPGGGPIINVPINIPNIPDIETICLNLANMNVAGIDQPGHFCYEHLPPADEGTFPPGGNVTVPVPIPIPTVPDRTNPNLPIIEDYEIDMDIWFNGPGGLRTQPMNIPSIPISYSGGASRNAQGPIQAGLQEEDNFSNLTMVDSSVTANTALGEANSIIGPTEFINLGGVDYGEFTAINSAIPFGATNASLTYHVAYNTARDIFYKEFDIDPVTGKYTANANADIQELFSGTGIVEAFAGTNIPTSYVQQFNYEISTDRANALATGTYGRPPISSTKTYLANVMGITHFANSDMGSSNTASRGFEVGNQDKRITKSDNYLNVLPPGSIGP